MVPILKTKEDRQIWIYLNETQRAFAKRGKFLNLTAYQSIQQALSIDSSFSPPS